MLNKAARLSIALIGILLIGLLFLPNESIRASAAQPQGGHASFTCLSCHEDLYYLHDTGKWYCITEHADRCTNCHDGQEPAPNKEEAHKGMVLHPQKDNGAKCQECHQQDAEARLAQFASLGGFKTIHETVSYVPAVSVETGLAEPAGTSRLVEALPWAIGGIFVFGFWLILVLLSPMKP
jgi:hypothetical protein